MLGRRAGAEEAELAGLHPRPQLYRQRGDVGQLQCHVAGEAGVDPARGGVGEQSQPAQGASPLEPASHVVGQRDHLVGRREHELPGMQDERLVAVGLDQPGQLRLLDGGVDVGVAVVLEDAEVAVQPHVDARRLDQPGIVRVEPDPAGLDLGLDVTIREQHAGNLPGPVPCLGGHSVVWSRGGAADRRCRAARV